MKGLLSTDIQDMGEGRNESGIELAKALCEQTNWPLKSVSCFAVCRSLELFYVNYISEDMLTQLVPIYSYY